MSLEELHEENMPVSEDVWMRKILFEEDDFNFEEERLAQAYAELPLLRKQILKLLYTWKTVCGSEVRNDNGDFV